MSTAAVTIPPAARLGDVEPASKWLAEYLADGPKIIQATIAAGKAAGLDYFDLFDAGKKIGVASQFIEEVGVSWWLNPDARADETSQEDKDRALAWLGGYLADGPKGMSLFTSVGLQAGHSYDAIMNAMVSLHPDFQEDPDGGISWRLRAGANGKGGMSTASPLPECNDAEPLRVVPPKPRTAFDEAGIPAELKDRPQWTNWRPDWDAAKGRWDKKPCDGGGRLTSPQTNPADWMTFEPAVANHRANPDLGIGFAVSEGDGFLGVDLDHAVDEEGNPLPWAERYLEALDSHAERTVSGQGFRAWIRAKMPPDASHKKTGLGPDQAGAVEFYDSKRFFTVSGDRVDWTPAEIGDRQEEFNAIYRELFPPPATADAADHSEPESCDLTVEQILAKARGARNGDKFRSLYDEGDLTSVDGDWNRADYRLVCLLAWWFGRDTERIDRAFRASALFRPKWDEKRGGTTYGGYTIAKVLARMGPNDHYRPPTKADPNRPRPLTDLGNAERLVARFGRDLRYVHAWRKYLSWDGRRWAVDDSGAVGRMAKRTVRGIYGEAERVEDDARRKAMIIWAMKSEDRRQINAIIGLAACEVPIRPGELDRDPWALNVLNGTLDLRSGELRPHRREDFLTKLAPVEYDPEAVCPAWESTLIRIFDRDMELVDYWQRLCGLALTGVVEQILAIAHGKGANGKSTLLEVLLSLLGPDYAMKAPPELLMVKRGETHPTERADLFGKRLVVAIETGEAARINETMVKELTGSDRIRARRMREDFWEFEPTHKVLLCTNHKPAVRGTDHAIWRRLKMVPFTVTIPKAEQVRDLAKELIRDEAPGILAWCVRGCLAWQREGLDQPEAVTLATTEYRQEEDMIGAFLAEHCNAKPGSQDVRAKASQLYTRYRTWAESAGEFPLTQKRFGAAMTERGFERLSNNGTWYLGVGLRVEEDAGIWVNRG